MVALLKMEDMGFEDDMGSEPVKRRCLYLPKMPFGVRKKTEAQERPKS